MGEPKLTIKLRQTSCAICGSRSPFNVVVIGAAGVYCKLHSIEAQVKSERHRFRLWAEGIDEGYLLLPTPLWDPRPVVDGESNIPKINARTKRVTVE